MQEDPTAVQCRARVGQLVSGKWRLDALIGVGGMAAVYMATHRNGSIAAIKLLHDEVAAIADVRERFLREAYIANKVGHPGTVKVLDDDTDDGKPYLVMELLQGESVEGKASRQGGRLSVEETLDVLDQTLAVLEAAHAQTIIHRDLKPENLFLTTSGQLKVLDFGIARMREENTRATQTGMVMGTPTFMAPEQAMGRWDDVDARTDIYAVGATAFMLLSGHPVHEAETVGEMLVAAATRPARSLARVMPAAPVPLVAMVDRALAYERMQRFGDATSFRKELAKVRAALGGQAAAPHPAGSIRPEAVEADPDVDAEREERRKRAARLENLDLTRVGPIEIENLRSIFTMLERSLVARVQYGPGHPETTRRTLECYKLLTSALASCEGCLAWSFTPYALTAGGETGQVVWEPEPPWNRVPYQLFADGVRTMGIVPGIEEAEFIAWVDLITVDPTTDLAPEDDLVTRLWDADFQHVLHQAIDSFGEGSQDQRLQYEAERNQVLERAHGEHGREAAAAWREARHSTSRGKSPTTAGSAARQIIDFVGKNEPIDAEAAARAANLQLQDEGLAEAKAARSLAIDEATRALLATRLDTDVRAASERFVVAAADAFVASARMGRPQAVTAPLRRAVESLGGGQPAKAMAMVLELREAVKLDGREAETDSLRGTLVSEVLSGKTLEQILSGSKSLKDDAASAYVASVARVLASVQGQHLDVIIGFVPHAPAGKMRELLLDNLRRNAEGNEAKIGQLFKDADLELGIELVRLLIALGSEAGQQAVAMASNSPHPLVRIEALGHLEGVSGTRVREEMRKLLEDPELSVRMIALKAMEQHAIAAAGPFLVLRIQDDAFLKLPREEREQSLQALSVLRPKRCEEICIALLKRSSLLRPEALESTREMAARYLAELARTDEAYHLLERTARSKPWVTSKRVRTAASAALDRLEQRAKELLEARKAGPAARKSIVAPRPDGSAAGEAASPAKSVAPPSAHGAARPKSIAAPPGAPQGGARPKTVATPAAQPARGKSPAAPGPAPAGAPTGSQPGARAKAATGGGEAPAGAKSTGARQVPGVPAGASSTGARPVAARGGEAPAGAADDANAEPIAPKRAQEGAPRRTRSPAGEGA